MKKIILFAAFTACLASCGVMLEETQPAPQQPARVARFVSTGKNVKVVVRDEVLTAPVIADLKVIEKKFTYIYVPNKAAQAEGEENCVKCAIREALKANGDADVIVGMETQTKFDGTFYNGQPVVESIIISGYPAKYTNFRHPDGDYWAKGEYLTPKPQVTIVKEEPAAGYNLELKDESAGIAEVKLPLPFSLGKNKDK